MAVSLEDAHECQSARKSTPISPPPTQHGLAVRLRYVVGATRCEHMIGLAAPLPFDFLLSTASYSRHDNSRYDSLLMPQSPARPARPVTTCRAKRQTRISPPSIPSRQ